MKSSKKINRNFIKLLKWLAFILGTLFLLLSVLPYLIPLRSLEGSRYEITYPESKFIEVDEIELHYRYWSDKPESGANILLVHGFGGSTFTWRYTMPFLEAQGYQVIAVDLPGFGLSERKIGFDHSSEARAALLWSFLDAIDSGAHWNLVGHSMGGATVAAMALQQQGRVESVILAAGSLARSEPSTLNLLLKYPPLNRWFRVLSTRLLFTEKRVDQFLLSAYGRQPGSEEVAGYYLPLTLEQTDLVLMDLFNAKPTPLLSRVDTLAIPVLCIWGEDDTWVPLDHGRELARLIPGAELVVLSGEGHCPMETAPDIFNEELVRFLEERQISD